MARRSELEAVLSALRTREEILSREETGLKQELGEAAALVGGSIADYASYVVVAADGSRVSDADMADEPRELRKTDVARLSV